MTILRGGENQERLYLDDLDFATPEGESVRVRRSDFPGVDMDDLVTRHKGRYALLGLFCRPGYRVLDAACGSGYASVLLGEYGVKYSGFDVDQATIEFARRRYGSDNVTFRALDFAHPNFGENEYDTIACIETIEHVEQQCQVPLLQAFWRALKPQGTFVVSSPESVTGRSGRSVHNEFHLWELSRQDFLEMLQQQFGPQNVEIVTHRAKLSSGVLTTCLYGICHRDTVL